MPYKLGYDKELDSLNHYMFIYPAVALMTILVHTTNRYNGFWDISWTFSVWLEAVAIIPQLYIVYKKREVNLNKNSNYRLKLLQEHIWPHLVVIKDFIF